MSLAWAVLAGMHPVNAHTKCMSKYAEHMGNYDFFSQHFPVPLSSIGSFAVTNNMSINIMVWTMTKR